MERKDAAFCRAFLIGAKKARNAQVLRASEESGNRLSRS